MRPLGMGTVSSPMWKEGQDYPRLALNECLVVGWIGTGEAG